MAITVLFAIHHSHFQGQFDSNVGYLLLNQGKAIESSELPRAELYLRRALDVFPNHASAWRGLGTVLGIRGQEVAAVTAWQKGGVTADYFSQWGDLAYGSQDYSQALIWYTRALRLQPDSAIIWFSLGQTYEALSDGINALVHYENTLRLANANIEDTTVNMSSVYYHQGMVYQWLQQPSDLQAAIEAYETAVSLNDFTNSLEKADSYTRLAQIWQWWEQDVDQQIIWLETATAIDPTYPTAHVLLGYAYYLNRQGIPEAEAEIQKALTSNPDYPSAYWYLGEIYNQEGLTQKAIALYQHVLNLDPNHQLAQQKLTELGALP